MVWLLIEVEKVELQNNFPSLGKIHHPAENSLLIPWYVRFL